MEILTPTEKLKALRETAKFLADGLGKVVTYDDATTQQLLDEAGSHAVHILNVIHDGNREDIGHAIDAHIGDAPVARFEHSVDALIARREQLNEAHRALINHPRGSMSDAGYAILQTEAQHLNRQITDIDDAISNLYAVREFCPE